MSSVCTFVVNPLAVIRSILAGDGQSMPLTKAYTVEEFGSVVELAPVKTKTEGYVDDVSQYTLQPKQDPAVDDLEGAGSLF